jgi:hypothetical protein
MGGSRVRLATWNLERPRPRSTVRTPRQLARIALVSADVWVLTETRVTFVPDPALHAVHTPPHPARRPDTDERWVGVWSRWPLVDTGLPPDPSGGLSAIVDRPEGAFVLYGTVLPWANEPGDDGRARMWQVHGRAIERQGEDWLALRGRFPDLPLVVAGDFNQDRDGSGWYGTARVRSLLSDALAAADLTCVTAEDVVATGRLRATHLVDHVAICRRWVEQHDVRMSCWERTADDGSRLSDHPTVAVDLVRR